MATMNPYTMAMLNQGPEAEPTAGGVNDFMKNQVTPQLGKVPAFSNAILAAIGASADPRGQEQIKALQGGVTTLDQTMKASAAAKQQGDEQRQLRSALLQYLGFDPNDSPSAPNTGGLTSLNETKTMQPDGSVKKTITSVGDGPKAVNTPLGTRFSNP